MNVTECDSLVAFAMRHKERILTDIQKGIPEAKNLVSVHQMLVRKADWPTWGIFAGCVDSYKKVTGLV